MDEVESASILAAPAEAETPSQRKINAAFALVLVVTIISLWYYFA